MVVKMIKKRKRGKRQKAIKDNKTNLTTNNKKGNVGRDTTCRQAHVLVFIMTRHTMFRDVRLRR